MFGVRSGIRVGTTANTSVFAAILKSIFTIMPMTHTMSLAHQTFQLDSTGLFKSQLKTSQLKICLDHFIQHNVIPFCQ